MIALLRVDHRLLHGQVVFLWCATLSPDCILIASDDVARDELRKTTLRLGKPSGTKLVIKGVQESIDAINSGVTDKYRMIVLVANVQDATALAKGCSQVKEIDLGGTKPSKGTHPISKMINLSDEDEPVEYKRR